jgi:hypothetical protein
MRARRVSFILLGLCSACSEVVSGVEPDARSVTQFEITRWGRLASQQWFLLVVDDAPTEAARRLREHLADDLVGFFDERPGACGISWSDPATYRPIDLRLIVVGSSGTLEPRFRDEEGLHALGEDASPALLAAFEAAGRQAILATETDEVRPSVGQFEVVHYMNLLGGESAPRSVAEAELAEVLPSPGWPFVGLAMTRPDASPEGPPLTWTSAVLDVRMLDWPEDGSCPVHDHYRADVPAFYPLNGAWTSPDCYQEAEMFDGDTVQDCAPTCMSRLPAVDAAGQVACRVYGEFPLEVDCEDNPGWTFLESTASGLGLDEALEVNLCELHQAEGDALEACIHDFACEGCEPSFCFRRPFTNEDEDDPAHTRRTFAADSLACTALYGQQSWDRLRIVHGADQVGGLIRVVCQE